MFFLSLTHVCFLKENHLHLEAQRSEESNFVRSVVVCLFVTFSSKTLVAIASEKVSFPKIITLGRSSLKGALVTINPNARVTKVTANLNVGDLTIYQGFFPKLYSYVL